MGKKRTIAKYAVYSLVVVTILYLVSYGVMWTWNHWPAPPPTVNYSVDIPAYGNATHATFWLQVYGRAILPPNISTLGDTPTALPYTITGAAQNNTHCTLEVRYFTSTISPVTGNNTAPITTFSEIADEHYELTIVGVNP